MLEPQLTLRRLIVTRGSHRAYDQEFHSGVNIIRGDNGSGKSTIADFIFFALGGELVTWHEEMKLCDYTYAEVSINGSVATLRRDIAGGATRRGMAIHWGTLSAVLEGSSAQWELYPYSAQGSKESFSQVLFRALGIPEVQGELASRVTMHQILRLVYADQITAINSLFRFEQFDSALTRDAVGMLLCGIYDSARYEVQLEIGRKQAQLDQISGRLDNIFLVYQESANLTDPAALRRLIAERERERFTLHSAMNVSEPRSNVQSRDPAVPVREQLVGVKRTLKIMQDELEQLAFDIVDSGKFLSAMERQLKSLSDSAVVRDSLGDLSFEYCPACYSSLSALDDTHTCHLCKSVVMERSPNSQLLRIRQEISLQLRESTQLQAGRIQRRDELLAQLPQLQARRNQLQMHLNSISETSLSDEERSRVDTYVRLGYLDREIEDLQRRLSLADAVASLQETKIALTRELAALRAEFQQSSETQAERRRVAYSTIVDNVVHLLHSDLPREERFMEANRVDFDFGTNRITVNGIEVFSASSTIYLKNSFHLALHATSLAQEYFRYPRFSLFDNIEDKGMEAERSHNFQHLIVAVSAASKSMHQIIFTTSKIAPELEHTEYVVGPYYTLDHKSLTLSPS